MTLRTERKQLNELRRDRGWTVQQLADAIYDATHIRVNDRTVRRFLDGIGEPSEVTRLAITRYLSALVEQGQMVGSL